MSEAASSVTQTLATLNAKVNPNGSTVSDCLLEYGISEAYGSSAPCASPPGSGEAVFAALGSLSGNTTYHFRISATNPGGTSRGSDQTFTTLTTLPTPHWYKNAAILPFGEKAQTIILGHAHARICGRQCHMSHRISRQHRKPLGAAKQETVAFATWECKAVGGRCAGAGGEERATPRGLPWPATIIEEGEEGSGVFRHEDSGVEVNIECYEGGIDTGNLLFKTGPVLTETGTWIPKNQEGTTAGKPSEVIFDAASGHPYAEAEAESPPGSKNFTKVAIKGTTKGQLKVEGYGGTPVPLITLGKP